MATEERRYNVKRRLAKVIPLEALSGSAAFVPCLLAIVLVAALGGMQGGYFQTTWYPAALFLLALLALTVAVVVEATRPPRAIILAIALLFAYALWSYLSIAWADDEGTAVDGAGRALMYAIVFALFALRPLAGGPALALVTIYGLGVGAIGLVELLKLGASTDPAGYFLDTRLAEPVGYHNGDVAFWFSGFWPCAYLASRRELLPSLRALLLGLAGILLGLGLMGQSRGWFFSLPVVVIAILVLVPGRGRMICSLLALAVAGIAMTGPLLEVHDRFEIGPGLLPLIDDAVRAIELAALCLGAVGFVVSLLDRRIEAPPRTARLVNLATVAVAALAVTIALGAVVVKTNDPIGKIGDSWREFKSADLPALGRTRFTSSLGSQRYDVWRVAWDLFKEKPLTGVGADNFQQDYLERARTDDRPRYPHSFELRVLAGTGAIGALLLVLALGAAAVAATRARLRGPPLTRVASAAALTVPIYWFLHGSVDWFWELPALGAAAFALLGLAAAGAPRATAAQRGARMPGRFALALGCAVCAAVLALPWLAERDMRQASRTWRQSSDAAFTRLERAKALNPFTSRPYLFEGAISLRLGRTDAARRAFGQALERNPRDWYATLELGAIASMQGDDRGANRLVARASRLLPGDETTRDVLKRVRKGGRVDVRRINRRLQEEARALVDPR
jgi:hypothetical protein